MRCVYRTISLSHYRTISESDYLDICLAARVSIVPSDDRAIESSKARGRMGRYRDSPMAQIAR
jgi:hypothetical protein